MRLATGLLPSKESSEIKRAAAIGAHREPIEMLKAAVEQLLGIQLSPSEYRDLVGAFWEKECDILQPHRTTYCTIEILPGAKFPKPKMYSMTPRDLKELRDFIDKNLARGFIQAAKSHVAALVLFKEKKDGSLRLCVDFKGLKSA